MSAFSFRSTSAYRETYPTFNEDRAPMEILDDYKEKKIFLIVIRFVIGQIEFVDGEWVLSPITFDVNNTDRVYQFSRDDLLMICEKISSLTIAYPNGLIKL